MKKIVVACGSGIATSTAVEAKVKDLLDNNGLSGQYTITRHHHHGFLIGTMLFHGQIIWRDRKSVV